MTRVFDSENFSYEMDKQIRLLAEDIYAANEAKGFWENHATMVECELAYYNRDASDIDYLQELLDDYRSFRLATKIALLGREVSEWLEVAREPEMPMGKVAKADIEEAADVYIRLLDLVAEQGWAAEFGEVIRAKLRYNASRPVRHGKKF